MDQFFTSLSKRQTMMLLTAITFGGQEGVSALEHLPEEEAELLQHRAQGILQIPRDKRIPLLVQEIKRLMKDRRGQLWSAEPERLAGLLKNERAALVEVVLRALPGPLADAVRSHLPSTGRVKLTREVRPQILDIVRWKLEERLAREASAHVPFKFTDVLLLEARELLTVCDRLGARVLGPALAGIPDTAREPAIATLPPHMRQLATRAVTANAPRKLPEDEASAQLGQYGGLDDLAAAIRGAGVHRLARASVTQSAEFAARLLEKHRGEFGQVVAKWVREERAKPTSRGDGGRTDIVTDLERLAARGLIERPVRLTTAPRPPTLGPPPGGRSPASSANRPSSQPREGRAESAPESSVVRRSASSSASSQVLRRDPIAEREARRAGATGAGQRERPRGEAPPESSPSRVSRVAPLDALPSRVSRVAAPPESSPSRVSRVVAPPESSPSRVSRVVAPPESSPSRVSRVVAPPERERSVPQGAPPSRTGTRPRSSEPPPETESSRIFRSPAARAHGRGAVGNSEPRGDASERPPRVMGTSPSREALRRDETQSQRNERPRPPGASGRGPRGGTR
ncbi:hypothetical protein [Melittangium boletus]|uniref:Uncharacterized protein n=1 Tax=Melittangium boletus DSM 14713 TaxID=1294270 RepID=A0A250IKW1_9BACT|nr:hypothetical protein [Melittangium boletus]ATB31821.1 hypothetical protein MEBOL_005290 [Melittangium boletus DSM 14713]